MNNAEAVINKIKEAMATVEAKLHAQTAAEIHTMEDALSKLSHNIVTFNALPETERLPYKNELIGLISNMTQLTQKAETTRTHIRQEMTTMTQKMKAKNSYGSEK